MNATISRPKQVANDFGIEERAHWQHKVHALEMRVKELSESESRRLYVDESWCASVCSSDAAVFCDASASSVPPRWPTSTEIADDIESSPALTGSFESSLASIEAFLASTQQSDDAVYSRRLEERRGEATPTPSVSAEPTTPPTPSPTLIPSVSVEPTTLPTPVPTAIPTSVPTMSMAPTISSAPTVSEFDVSNYDELNYAITSAGSNDRQRVINLVADIEIEMELFLPPGASIKIAGARATNGTSSTAAAEQQRVRVSPKAASTRFLLVGYAEYNALKATTIVALENLDIRGFAKSTLSVYQNSIATVLNCIFAENYITSFGTVYVSGPNARLQVQRSDFFDNINIGTTLLAPVVQSGDAGGEENFVDISDSNFVRNAGPGGVLFIRNDNHLQIRNCSFHDNILAEAGGAIHFQGGTTTRSQLNITLSGFYNNGAIEAGGAIFAGDLTRLHLEQTTFIENKAKYAGAIALSLSSVALFVNSTFRSNIAKTGHGGAVYTFGSQLDIINSNFTNNSALTDGGAVHAVADSDIDLRGATQMNGNSALEGRGGAISLLASTLRSDEGALTFVSNSAKRGGAISADTEINIALVAKPSSVRIYAGCRTTVFELHWSDNPHSAAWAVVRRTGDMADQTSSPAPNTTRHLSYFMDQRGEWMVLNPTVNADTSVSFCLSPGEI